MTSIAFLAPALPAGAERFQLSITAGSLGRQSVEVMVNGQAIGAATWQDGNFLVPQTRTFTFDAALLRPGRLNEISFRLPNAHFPPPFFRDRRLARPVAGPS